jgi:hypothetical protein
VEEVCVIALRLLRAFLRRSWPDADPGLIESAAEDAILKYLGNPRRFDPRRAGLLTWLEAIALRRLRDLERPEHRARAHESSDRELPLAEGVVVRADGPALTAAWIVEHRALLLAAARSDAERRFIAARLAGAPRDVQADSLGVHYLRTALARKEMNRVWELLGRRARRLERLRTLPAQGTVPNISTTLSD